MAERLTAIVDADVGSFMRKMSAVDARMGQTARGIGSASRGIATFGRFAALGAVGGVAAMGALGTAVGKVGLQYGMAKQQAKVAFSVMLGDGRKAVKMMRDLERFATATPFEMVDLQTAAQRMLALGWNAKRVLPDLRAIGDAAAASPQGMVEGLNRITLALGQMRSKGKASGDEMLQLAEAGIPAWRFLAEAAGKSVADMQKEAEKGAITADFAIEAILGGMRRKFGGMMKEQAKTLGGSFSTLKDTVTQGLGRAMEPAIPILTRWSQRAAKLLEGPSADRIMARVGEGVQDALRGVERLVAWGYAHRDDLAEVGGALMDGLRKGGEGAKWLVQRLGDVAGWVKAHRSEIREVGEGIGEGLAKAADAAMWLGRALGRIPVDDIARVAKEIWNVADAMGVGTIAGWIGDAAGAALDFIAPLGRAKSATLDIATAWEAVKRAAIEANRTTLNLATAVGQRNQARTDVRQARRDYAGATTDAQRIAATRALSAAQARLIETTRMVKEENLKAEQAQTKQIVNASAMRAQAIGKMEDAQTRLRGLRQGEAAALERVRQAEATGVEATVKQEQDKLARIRESIKDATEQVATAQAEKVKADSAWGKTLGQWTATNIAQARAFKEVPQFASAASNAISRLARGYSNAGSAGTAAAAGLARIGSQAKTTDAQIKAIDRLTTKAQGLGRTKAALKIVAESKTADEAVAKLEKLTAKKRTTNVAFVVTGSGKVQDILTGMFPKLAKGVDPDVRIGVTGRDNLQGALAEVERLRGRDGQRTNVYVTTYKTTVERTTKAKATGGRVPEAASGGRYSAPTYLVAEAGYPEWVIPTDPKYRDRAKRFLSSAANDLGVQRFASGGLTPTKVDWRRFSKWGMNREEKFAQRYQDDTSIYVRRWERSGGAMQPGEYRQYAKRLETQRGMLTRLRGRYAEELKRTSKTEPKDAEAKQKWRDRRRELQEKHDATRMAILGLAEDSADARANAKRVERERAQAAADKKREQEEKQKQEAREAGERTGMVGDVVVGGLRGVDERIAIARAGLGGNLVSLLEERKAMLEKAFRGSKSQTDRAALASEIAATTSDLASVRDAAAAQREASSPSSSTSGGGGGGATIQNITNTLNVTVEGSVASERDLGEAMLRTFVEWARSGKQPLAAIGFGAG